MCTAPMSGTELTCANARPCKRTYHVKLPRFSRSLRACGEPPVGVAPGEFLLWKVTGSRSPRWGGIRRSGPAHTSGPDAAGTHSDPRLSQRGPCRNPAIAPQLLPPQAGIETQMITGDQVKAARALLGWSQFKLSRQSGISEATIHRFEKGLLKLRG